MTANQGKMKSFINFDQEGLKAAMGARLARDGDHNNSWPKGDESFNKLHLV
jgi:hypothetical protein